MTFFDRKEEVLEVELTQHGKYLLSLGELKPEYYSFFDDDILYDFNCVSGSEAQNNAELRIKESPRVHCQTNFHASLRSEHPNRTLPRFKGRMQNIFEREYALNSELGNADYYSNNMPSWEIDFLKGRLSDATLNYSGSGPDYRIPQVNVSASVYKKIVGELNLMHGPDIPFEETLRYIEEYETREAYIEVRRDFIFLEIDENNTTFQRENFDIELFEVRVEDSRDRTHDENGNIGKIETLTPLKFVGPQAEEVADYVDYYFNISVDTEIDKDTFCRYKGIDSSKGIFMKNIFECEDPEGYVPTDQYRTGVRNIGEVCD